MGSLHVGMGAYAAGAGQTTFASPEQGVEMLLTAVRGHDRATLRRILGLHSEKVLSSGDPVADAQVRDEFIDAAAQGQKIVKQGDDRATLIIGKEDWPFPIPLVRQGRTWHFDTAAGAEEIIDRRIGGNEFDAIEVCRAYVDAQREYGEQNRTQGGGAEYAQRILSSPGKHDGLYWPTRADENESPMGPLIADARAEGYRAQKGQRTPYHGYYFRVLTGQGPDAPGGAMDYIVDGHMTGGFALIAFPARYGVSGVMSFIVNRDGIVFQKDLGPDTPRLAESMPRYNPDKSWQVATPGE